MHHDDDSGLECICIRSERVHQQADEIQSISAALVAAVCRFGLSSPGKHRTRTNEVLLHVSGNPTHQDLSKFGAVMGG